MSDDRKFDEWRADVADVEPTGRCSTARRRSVLKASFLGLLGGLAGSMRRSFGNAAPEDVPMTPVGADAPVEYIVIGSGAGGGPLACNLAKAGHKVVLFEAGGGDGDDIAAVPFFTAFTSEDERVRWDYFVRHYADDVQQMRDSKYVKEQGGVERDGIWYPRVGSLGGCTLHSFLIEMYPSDSDWNYIATLTGDASWRADNMRKYFERFERCRYADSSAVDNPSRHGFGGWQPTEIADPRPLQEHPKVLRILLSAVCEATKRPLQTLQKFFARQLDPNDWRGRRLREGVWNVPLFTRNGRRFGTRQLICQTKDALPNNLIVLTHSLVTRILLEGKTAVGVEYLHGKHLYRADPRSDTTALPGQKLTMRATREVIVCGGAFNSPQLLKLSGIGPRKELLAHGIEPVVDLPGVGENLQDRYEVGIVTETKSPFTVIAECRPGQADDPCYADWLSARGPYTSPGAVCGILHKSETARVAGRPDPDLFIFAALTRFKGYFPGYSYLDIAAPDARSQFTWAILKAHNRNRGGTVKLRSADPRDTPLINFHYFEEGTDKAGEDLDSVVDGIEFVRRMNQRIEDFSVGEFFPGAQAQSRDAIGQFVRDEAWGHHASCTCRIGRADDRMAVVDSEFRVHGTKNLRVVDASVFPRIPGYFIITPIYMISEKASDVILESAVVNRSYSEVETKVEALVTQ